MYAIFYLNLASYWEILKLAFPVTSTKTIDLEHFAVNFALSIDKNQLFGAKWSVLDSFSTESTKVFEASKLVSFSYVSKRLLKIISLKFTKKK